MAYQNAFLQRGRSAMPQAPAAQPGQFGPSTGWEPSSIGNYLAQAQQAGAFSPGGNSALRNQAMRLWAGRRRRAGGLGRLLGLDPMQQRGAMMQAEIAGGDDMANLLGEGQMRQQDFLRQLLSQAYGYNQQERQGNIQAAQQRQLQRSQAKQERQGAFGQLAGAGISAAPWEKWLGGGQ